MGSGMKAPMAGLVNAVNDGKARGLITSQQAVSQVSQLQSSTKGNSTKQKLQTFVVMVQQASGKTVNAAYALLLIDWANDLIARTP